MDARTIGPVYQARDIEVAIRSRWRRALRAGKPLTIEKAYVAIGGIGRAVGEAA